MRPGEEQSSWHGERLWPVYTGFSLGGGARTLPDHSQRWLEDKGARETPVGKGPPGLREGLARSAPWMVCCYLDSACCRKSAPLYLEPCSGERAAEITRYPSLAPSHYQDQEARHSMHRMQKQKRRNMPGFEQNHSSGGRGWQTPPHQHPSQQPPFASALITACAGSWGEWWTHRSRTTPAGLHKVA